MRKGQCVEFRVFRLGSLREIEAFQGIFVVIEPGLLQKIRIHRIAFVGLPLDCDLQVLPGGLDIGSLDRSLGNCAQVLYDIRMISGVYLLRPSCGAEDACRFTVTFAVSLRSERGIASMSVALPVEGCRMFCRVVVAA